MQLTKRVTVTTWLKSPKYISCLLLEFSFNLSEPGNPNHRTCHTPDLPFYPLSWSLSGQAWTQHLLYQVQSSRAAQSVCICVFEAWRAAGDMCVFGGEYHSVARNDRAKNCREEFYKTMTVTQPLHSMDYHSSPCPKPTLCTLSRQVRRSPWWRKKQRRNTFKTTSFP